MATMSLLFLTLLLFSLHPSPAQVIISSSPSFSSSPLDLPMNSSPQPTNETPQFWPSFSSRGRSDVPVRVTIRDRLTTTNKVLQRQRMSRPTVQSPASFISTLSTHNLSSGPILTQPTASRPRTDMASLALLSAAAKREGPTKGSTLPPPTLPPSSVFDSTSKQPEQGPVKQREVGDWQDSGSGSTPTVLPVEVESHVPRATFSNEMAQFRPQAQTAISEDLSSQMADVKTLPTDSQTVKPRLFTLTASSRISTTLPPNTRATLSPVVTQATARTVALTGERSLMLLEWLLHNAMLVSSLLCSGVTKPLPSIYR